MWTRARLLLWATLAVGLCGSVAAQQPPKKESSATVKSKLTITVPQDDAELFIEGQPTKATGNVRPFETPPIEKGKAYKYKFEVKWAPNNYTRITRTREVEFKGGDEVVVDLSKEEGTDRAVIRYVPTPDDIVAQMIKLANIKPDDIVFEPGCGDARITIAAVKAGAKKGVGVDLDPERVEESKENVKKAGVEGKVEIRLGDALDIKDLSDASVVFLYMGNEFDMLIRPILWKQLKVGSRVVSHRFLMGDWKPEKTVNITGEDGDEYELHLWTITEEVKKRANEKDKK